MVIRRAWSLRVDPGEPPDQRRLLIDTHTNVLAELKRRGHDDIRATVTGIGPDEVDDDGMPLPPGEYVANRDQDFSFTKIRQPRPAGLGGSRPPVWNATSHAGYRGQDCPSAPAMQHSGGADLTAALHR
jgi:hypothetical protein